MCIYRVGIGVKIRVGVGFVGVELWERNRGFLCFLGFSDFFLVFYKEKKFWQKGPERPPSFPERAPSRLLENSSFCS